MNINYKKYLWKNRLLVLNTPNYKNKEYLNSKNIYQNNIKEFHKRFIKLISKLNSNNKFEINLIGFNGGIMLIEKKINLINIFNNTDKFSINELKIKYPKLSPKNLSLYSDYNPKTTIKNLGFKNKEKALYTIDKIKDEPLRYQINLINTMIGRAENHPHKTNEMKEAINIFKEWKKKNIKR